MPDQLIDHLFRHQFGKMVSILTKIFGFEHLETIEDAVQDTFIQAMKSWRSEIPDNPEAWLTAAAKHRVIDIFRAINAQKSRAEVVTNPISTLAIDEFFLPQEIEDSQLRMIFTACHPDLDPKEQIAFALRSVSGFSTKEIAAALLSQESTIKKRLQRARKMIAQNNLQFEIPSGVDLVDRINRVMEVVYLIFNEGFHSNKQEFVIRKELCGESLRLCKMLLARSELQIPPLYALFALLCFHSSRLESKVNDNNELINLADQDRATWYFPLIAIGNEAMNKAVELTNTFSSYHYEAAIAAEHLRAARFEDTNWKTIANWYEQLWKIQPNPHTKLSLAVSYLQLGDLQKAYLSILETSPKDLAHKAYLYHATLAEYYHLSSNKTNALASINTALELVTNKSESAFLQKKKESYGQP